jgi:hypothetical protein
LLALVAGSAANAQAPSAVPGFPPWDIEQYRTGYVAVTRANDHRSALLIFCTLVGTKDFVYAYDGRGQRPEDIPISTVRVLLTPTIDLFGQSMPSTAATFDNDGYIIRLRLALPDDFEPPHSGEMTLSSGPEATTENRWSVTAGTDGLDDSLRIAFQNCV